MMERTYLDSSKHLGSEMQALIYQEVHEKGRGEMMRQGQRSGDGNKISREEQVWVSLGDTCGGP